MKIYFLRHGQTLANISYQYCGVTDSPLSEEGKLQLAEKRQSCAYPSIEGLDVYTSGLTRTEQTLQILYGDVEHSADRDFAEMNFGIFEGRSYDELKDTEEYQAWLAGDHMKNHCPGGESGAEVQERVLKGIERLLDKGRDALIVCHGGTIALAFYHFFPDTGLNWYEVQPKNGEGYIFEFEGRNAVCYTRIPDQTEQHSIQQIREDTMRRNHEIKERRALLDERGRLTEPGYTKGLLMDYDRKAIKGGAMRIKEWDYYLVTTHDFAVALTIDDNSYMGLDSISLLDFRLRWEHTNSPMAFFTGGKKNFPKGSDTGDVKSSGKGYSMEFLHRGDHRILRFKMDDFCGGRPIEGEIRLENPDQESMVIVTPFPGKDTAFYYNQKINCMKASGTVKYGDTVYDFDRPDAYGVLDWGRGVWTYENTWYWGSLSAEVDGVPFGWNIGYGFGDTSAASENMLFYGGKAHKLGDIVFNIPMKDGKEDYLSPWTFSSDDGRFEMDFTPVLDRAACTDFKILCSDQHQVFGYFSGKAILDDGTAIEIEDLLGFAEKVHNKW